MKYFVTTVLTLLLGFYVSWAQPFCQLVSRNLSAKDGLSSNQVYDILQDKRGYCGWPRLMVSLVMMDTLF